VTLGFRRDVDEACALLGHYAALSGSFYRRFGTTYQLDLDFLALEDLTIGYPEMSVRNCHSTLRNIPEQRRYQFLLVRKRL
jgi:hypothetical protein